MVMRGWRLMGSCTPPAKLVPLCWWRWRKPQVSTCLFTSCLTPSWMPAEYLFMLLACCRKLLGSQCQECCYHGPGLLQRLSETGNASGLLLLIDVILIAVLLINAFGVSFWFYRPQKMLVKSQASMFCVSSMSRLLQPWPMAWTKLRTECNYAEAKLCSNWCAHCK